MRLYFSLSFVLVAAGLAAAVPAGDNAGLSKRAKPPYFVLAGDSTTASGGGWGDGFLATLRNGAAGKNLGHNGATTVSFRAGGDWAAVLEAVKASKADYNPFVTIQVRSRFLGDVW